jgi:predicted kinase
MKQRIVMLKGLPASGKTTWAKQQLKEFPGVYKRVNKDDLRAMLDDSIWSKQNENFILRMRDWIIGNAIMDGYSVIVDDTNLHDKHKQKLSEIAKANSVELEIKFFDTSVEECIERDSKRQNYVGEKVIKTMYNRFLKPQEADNVLYLISALLKPAIICDIDGTIAHNDNKRGFFEWMKVGLDEPKKNIIRILEKFKKDGYIILIVSGRDSVCLNLTLEWLSKHKVPYDYLYMRATNDNRQDAVIKKEIFNDKIRNEYNVDFVLDDRQQVVDMWREIGLTCLQVDYGDF